MAVRSRLMSGGANVLLGSAPAGPASHDYPSTSTSLSYALGGSGDAILTTSSGSRVPDDVLQLLRSDAEAVAYNVVNPRFVGAVPFRNLAPQSRMERRAVANKDSLEKQRLRDRTGGYYRADPLGQKIVGFEQGAPGYQSEALRFDTDVGGEQRRMRAVALEEEHRKIANIRAATMARNEMRRQQMIAASDAEMERQLALQRHPTKSLNNKQSVPYDAITLVYDTSGAGQALLESDHAVRQRAQNRAVLLASKMTADGYNPITGEKLVLPDMFQVAPTSH